MITQILVQGISSLTCFARRLREDRRGNIMLIMTFALIPLTFAIGFGIDYSRAQKLQTQLNSFADSAALAAVDPAMLCQSSDTAKSAATGMFTSQASTLQDLVSVTPTVTINPANSAAGCAGTLRQVTIAYTATVRNVFSSILGAQTLTISGSASSDAAAIFTLGGEVLCGAHVAGEGEFPAWMVWFSVTDCDATAAKVKELGGAVFMEPNDMDFGRGAVVADPHGAVFGIGVMAAAP